MAQNDQTSKDDKVEMERPASVRESINAAIEEHADDNTEDKFIKGKPVEREDSTEEIDDKDIKDRKKDVEEIPEAKRKDKKEKIVPDEKELPASEEVEAKKKVKEEKAPSILPKEIQENWDKLPESAKTYFTKTQKELADTKAELGRTKQSYREMDAVIEPYRGAIQQWNVTPAQTVERLFNWMSALSGPDRYNAIQELAAGFNINLSALLDQTGNQQQIQQTQQHQDNQNQDQIQQQDVDPRVAQAIEAMYNEVTSLKGAQAQQKQSAAANYVENWAGLKPDGSFDKKPHFPQVRQLMFSLLQGGSIPLINGQLDLDKAYEMACYSNSDIRELMLGQQEEDKQAKLKETRDKKAAEDRAKVAKAKSLNVGIRPSSPTGEFSSDSKKLNSKSTSVRDSLLSAIREVNN